jgi:hypothetical protein
MLCCYGKRLQGELKGAVVLNNLHLVIYKRAFCLPAGGSYCMYGVLRSLF